ncbi:MAG: DUF1800 domain-containing protein [Rubrivivax sp.]|nr:DUF1800 domain-containing protein [Rubrivivax sp.]
MRLRAAARGLALSLSIACALLASGCGGGNAPTAARSPQDARQRPLAEATAAALLPRQAASFLNMATFGATSASLNDLLAAGSYKAWLEQQMNMPVQTSHWNTLAALYTPRPTFPALSYGVNPAGEWIIPVMWRAYISSPDQLRKRVGAALLEVFVINERVALIGLQNNQYSAAGYIDMLERHAFGNFRDLLEDVALSPTMGNFLSHRGNRKASYDAHGVEIRQPDENFARELLQLFSIGLVELNADGTPRLVNGAPVETYTQSDIFNLARVFTGWDYDNSVTGFERLRARMVEYPNLHSPEAKRFLGLTIAAGTGGRASLKQTLDHLFQHPNVGPFIGRQLIQRLVTSNPSPAYVARVSAVFADNGQGVRGDMKAVIRSILTDPEALSGPDSEDMPQVHGGKLREPTMRVVAVARVLGARSTQPLFPLGNLTESVPGVGQTPVNSPSVFNFFRPGYVPPASEVASAGLVAPEFQIVTGSQIISSINFINTMIADEARVFEYAGMPELQALANDPPELLARAILLLTGRGHGIGPAAREAMTAALTEIPASETRRRVVAALQMVASTPGFLVQR